LKGNEEAQAENDLETEIKGPADGKSDHHEILYESGDTSGDSFPDLLALVVAL
jgi:hypothetical protein